jgi:hypothetical protein
MTKTFLSTAFIAGVLLLASCGGSDSKPVGSSAEATQAPSSQSQQAAATAQPTAAAQARAAQSTSGKLDPCALLTKAAAEAAAGAPVKDGQPEDSKNPLGQQLCGYPAANELSVRFVLISVVTDGNLSKELKDRKYSAKKLFTDSREGAPSIPGVGEDAYMQGDRSLHVLQKDVYFSVSVNGGVPPRHTAVTPETLTTMARSVLEQLPR